jgi:Na+/melibiose symporter-like transporter
MMINRDTYLIFGWAILLAVGYILGWFTGNQTVVIAALCIIVYVSMRIVRLMRPAVRPTSHPVEPHVKRQS